MIGVILVLMMTMIFSVPRQRDMLLLSMPSGYHWCNPISASVNIEVDFDDTILWKGNPVSPAELQQYLIAAVHEQAQLHIKPSPIASYAVVAATTRQMLNAGVQIINIDTPAIPSSQENIFTGL
ncbi:ExbD/TolR family protein [Undibacterium sp. Ji42W]|uniref:ExbD/TolR family protein n=1 Tax=Undibacterium sp. Ji42W TaxID=3413039 RepID=UPI003BF3B834